MSIAEEQVTQSSVGLKSYDSRRTKVFREIQSPRPTSLRNYFWSGYYGCVSSALEFVSSPGEMGNFFPLREHLVNLRQSYALCRWLTVLTLRQVVIDSLVLSIFPSSLCRLASPLVFSSQAIHVSLNNKSVSGTYTFTQF